MKPLFEASFMQNEGTSFFLNYEIQLASKFANSNRAPTKWELGSVLSKLEFLACQQSRTQ